MQNRPQRLLEEYGLAGSQRGDAEDREIGERVSSDSLHKLGDLKQVFGHDKPNAENEAA
jgi:hypothetical protein